VDVLPLNQCPTSYPFASFVLNIQAFTKPHKDSWDDTLCVVVQFGQWMGGELVLHELGVVLDLAIGDVLFFPSGQVTHFNMPYAGTRCSLVLFSDKHGRDWVRFRNGWDGHMVVKPEKSDDNSDDCDDYVDEHVA
jgi:hypothetical protein